MTKLKYEPCPEPPMPTHYGILSPVPTVRREGISWCSVDAETVEITIEVENETDERIVQAIITLGRSLRLNVVAEGVDDAETLRRLQAMDCDVVQGYHLTPPLPADELELGVRRTAPRAELRPLTCPPVVGAALLAMELAEVPITGNAATRLRTDTTARFWGEHR